MHAAVTALLVLGWTAVAASSPPIPETLPGAVQEGPAPEGVVQGNAAAGAAAADRLPELGFLEGSWTLGGRARLGPDRPWAEVSGRGGARGGRGDPRIRPRQELVRFRPGRLDELPFEAIRRLVRLVHRRLSSHSERN